jgi:hypothetical protein
LNISCNNFNPLLAILVIFSNTYLAQILYTAITDYIYDIPLKPINYSHPQFIYIKIRKSMMYGGQQRMCCHLNAILG